MSSPLNNVTIFILSTFVLSAQNKFLKLYSPDKKLALAYYYET